MSRACDHAINQMYYYLDGEITWYRRMRVRRHLRKCNFCCGAYDFEERLKTMIRESGREEPPQELFDNLRALIQREAAEDPDV